MFLGACQEVSQHKTDLWLGVRLDSAIDTARLRQGMVAADTFGVHDYSLELIVYADTVTGLPKISRTSLTQLSRVLPLLGGRALTLILTRVADRPVYIEDKVRPQSWFSAYRIELIELAKRIKGFSLKRVAIGNDFQPLEKYANEWRKLAKDTLFGAKTRTIYVANLDRAESFEAFDAFDEIGVHYQTAADASEKAFARKWNKSISALALKLKKPVFIANANLIDKDKKTQLKYRLSFWADKVMLSGLTINSIFAYPALVDTVAYFGCAGDTALTNFVKKTSE